MIKSFCGCFTVPGGSFFKKNPLAAGGKKFYLRLVPGIRFRGEFFGGLVYDPRTGTTLDVDKEAFHFLYMIKDSAAPSDELIKLLVQNKVIKGQGASIIKTINQLIELDIVEKKKEIPGHRP